MQSPQKVKIISQWFVLKYRFGYSRLKFSFNIYEISKSIYANAISHHEERIDKGYYYYDTRNELLFNKGFLAKKEHEYPIIAIFLPAFDTQGILCMNGIIEGNHRVTNAKINNQKIDVVIIDTILLPLDVFGSTNEWLLYIMLANYYELMYKPEYFTSYSDIEKHLLKNEVA